MNRLPGEASRQILGVQLLKRSEPSKGSIIAPTTDTNVNLNIARTAAFQPNWLIEYCLNGCRPG